MWALFFQKNLASIPYQVIFAVRYQKMAEVLKNPAQ
jgi:hypothetical protein